MLVWLKDSLAPTLNRHLVQFQFHAGLIKSQGGRNYLVTRQVFQFHAGLIKSVCSNLDSYGEEISFNSMLVWLKAEEVNGTQTISNEFQFHAGLIKRCCVE